MKIAVTAELPENALFAGDSLHCRLHLTCNGSQQEPTTQAKLLLGYVQIFSILRLNPDYFDADAVGQLCQTRAFLGTTAGGVVGIKNVAQNPEAYKTWLWNSLNFAYQSLTSTSTSEAENRSIDLTRGSLLASKPPKDSFLLWSTRPLVLFTQLDLGPETSQEWISQVRVPENVPCSHHGKFTCMETRVVLSLQLENQKLLTFTWPIRVFPHVTLEPEAKLKISSLSTTEMSFSEGIILSYESQTKLVTRKDLDNYVSNRIMDIASSHSLNNALAVEAILNSRSSRDQKLTQEMKSNKFAINVKGERIAEIVFKRRIYQLASSIAINLNLIQDVDKVTAELISKDTAFSNSKIFSDEQICDSVTKSTSELKSVFLELQIPPSKSPSFETDMYKHSWSIKFSLSNKSSISAQVDSSKSHCSVVECSILIIVLPYTLVGYGNIILCDSDTWSNHILTRPILTTTISI